jgi:hypothetical protein
MKAISPSCENQSQMSEVVTDLGNLSSWMVISGHVCHSAGGWKVSASLVGLRVPFSGLPGFPGFIGRLRPLDGPRGGGLCELMVQLVATVMFLDDGIPRR